MELDDTKKHKILWKKTRKCYNCGKIGHLAKVCQSKKQATTTQSKKQGDRRKRDLREERQLNATKTETKSDHVELSWTACYDNNCYTHLSEKQESE